MSGTYFGYHDCVTGDCSRGPGGHDCVTGDRSWGPEGHSCVTGGHCRDPEGHDCVTRDCSQGPGGPHQGCSAHFTVLRMVFPTENYLAQNVSSTEV